MKSGYSKTITTLVIIIFMSISSSPLYPAGKTVLKVGGKVLVEFKTGNMVNIKGEEFKYNRIKKNKRLKIVSEKGNEGVFVKRYGTKIRLRDLEGNLIHLIRKAGNYYKVKTVMGTELAVIKKENGKITVSNRESNSIYNVVPEQGNIVFKDKNGSTVFTLEGETNPFHASFLALTPLSLLERVACYLTYR